MAKLTDEIKESLAGKKIVFLADSFKKSIPNAVPIGLLSYWMMKHSYFRPVFQKDTDEYEREPAACNILLG